MGTPLAGRLVLTRGDITKVSADAIVNAANTSLLGGGGVDGAIHHAAGPGLLAECRTLGGCPTGSAKITKAYKLPARFVIHAVGPRYSDGLSGEAELLAGCYRTAIKLAIENRCRSLAFPAISCGAYGYPLPEAARIALTEVARHLGAYPQPATVLFVLFDDGAYSAFQNAYQDLLDAEAESGS